MRRFLIRLAFINVFKKRIRAMLTIGGVAISTSVMVMLFGVGAGLQTMVTEQIDKSANRNVITVNTKNAKQLKLNSEAVSQFQSITGVSGVEHVIGTSGQITISGNSVVLPVYAVSGGYFDAAPMTTTSGKLEDTMRSDKHNIVLSKAALKAIGMNEGTAVGKRLDTTFTISQDFDSKQKETSREVGAPDFEIKAIVDKGSTPVAYVPAGYLMKEGVDNFSDVQVLVTYPEKVPAIRESIEQLGYQTANVQDAIDQVNQIFKVIRSILIVFGFITVLVTIFGTINTITIQLIEETKQIGFLRIMGIRREDVGTLFVMQAVILSVSGVVVGIVGGLVLGAISNGIVRVAASSGPIDSQAGMYVYQIPLIPIIIMLMLAFIIGWAIGLTPAKRAIDINPLAALKT